MEVMDASNRDENLSVDSDDDLDEQQQHGQPAGSLRERRRAQHAIFDAWITTDAAQAALQPKTKDGDIEYVADEEKSVQALLMQNGTKIVDSPRDYQLELFERAKNQNTIAVLDTGSGKTLIAVLLLRHTIDEELEHRAAGRPPRMSFFLVPSVTLVFQQYAVLETNLDHEVARVCGADNCDNWTRERWIKLFHDHKVVVCTPDILVHCLSRAFITMAQINLLIFDEAHHTKKNHAYAIIIKLFYLEGTARPRVFGMTASPVDAKVDGHKAVHELETLLHSRIATTDSMGFVAMVHQPKPVFMNYDALPLPFDTDLLQIMRRRYGHIDAFRHTLDRCRGIASQLGTWCADQYLMDAFDEKRLQRYEHNSEQKFYTQTTRGDIGDLDQQQDELSAAFDFMQQERIRAAANAVSDDGISDKVRKLQLYLASHYEHPTRQRCIVFVERRDTARLLTTLFHRIGTQHLKPTFLVGDNSRPGEDNFSFRQQVLAIQKFHSGEINCLFATTVAEEGLDIPNCNLVIRFDLYKTMIQYVQSRGRARQRNSTFVNMCERGNTQETQLIHEIRHQEAVMRKICQDLPENRKLVGHNEALDALLEKEKNLRKYVDPVSGATLNYRNAMAVLENYVSVLPVDTNDSPHPTWVVSASGSKFVCEVLLPPPAGIRSMIGRIHTSKSLAKRAAAFDACMALREKGHLDENLTSRHRRKIHAMRNAELALTSKDSKFYAMQLKPTAWKSGREMLPLPAELFMTIIDFENGLERAHRPLALLTRTKMPNFPTFPIYLSDSFESKVVPAQVADPIPCSARLIQKLTKFTLRMFLDVFSKKFENSSEDLSYWVAPLKCFGLKDELDFALLDEVYANERHIWKESVPPHELVDKFIVDDFDGGRKFVTNAVATELGPFDTMPAGFAKSRFGDKVLDYSVSLWKNSRQEREYNPNQPVMRAEKLSMRYDVLATPTPKQIKESKSTQVYLCLEALKLSILPADVVTSCFMFPATIHRFESYLIAQEACEVVGVTCNPDVALAAVTKDSDNSGDHGEERVNFQRGMGENYERLEFIGDTFLKTATTISVFISKPNDLETDLHVERMLMLCNQNLFNTAKKLELYRYVRSIAFSRRLWYPEGLNLTQGKGVKKKAEIAAGDQTTHVPKAVAPQEMKHSLADKTIADVCEAMIGAAFVTYDRPGEPWRDDQFDGAVQAVTKLVDDTNHPMTCWNDYRTAYVLPTHQTAAATASQRDLAKKVELEHPYTFRYPRLLRSAFVHPSNPRMYEQVPNYERLEFLGDALLDMASITHLFYRFPDKDPQWLTEHKMAMVSNKFLGAVCVDIGFHRHLRYASSILEHQIREYATELLEAKRTAGTARDYWTTVSDPPKCLPDIIESFVGAMFIDSNFDYGVVRDFFDRNIKWYFEDMSIYDGFANNHPCTHLYNLLQTTYRCRDYRLMAKEAPAPDGVELERKDVVAVVVIHNEIVSHSKGKSGRYARLRVAQKALGVLDGLAPFEFRARFGCHCDVKEKGNGVVNGENMEEALVADCNV